MKVRVAYQAFDQDGEPVDEAPSEVEYIHGFGVLLPELEAALAGQFSGATRELTLPASAAFGRRRPEAVIELDRDEFPENVAPGDRYEAENAAGALVILRVLEVRDDAVVVDTNHPLAGQRVRFALRVVSVEPASEAELAQAEARLQNPNPEQSETQRPQQQRQTDTLIPLERLLRGPTQRYELGPSPASPDGTDEEP